MPRHATAGLIAAGMAAYILLSTLLMSHAPEHPATLALLFGPVVAGTAIHAAREPRALNLLVAAAALVGCGLLMSPAVASAIDTRLAYVAQHGAIHLMLAWGFGATLRQGRTPLITALAKSLHTRWSDDLERYTTALTRTWVRYFLAMVVLSLLIYAALPWTWWSIFCTIITPASAALLFLGEHVWRYRMHPEFERVSVSQAWRAYRGH